MNGKRICAVLTIFRLFNETHTDLQNVINDNIAELFSMLRLKPGNYRHSIELNYLTSFIPDDQYEVIAGIFVRFINLIIPTNIEWVYVIPILHIFQKRIKHCEVSEISYKDIQWTDQLIDESEIKTPISKQISK